jgi:hypothetical protein
VHLFYESDTFYVMKKWGEGNVVLFSRFVVAADVEERGKAEIAISIRVIVASGLIVDFECKVLYQILALIGIRGM